MKYLSPSQFDFFDHALRTPFVWSGLQSKKFTRIEYNLLDKEFVSSA